MCYLLLYPDLKMLSCLSVSDMLIGSVAHLIHIIPCKSFFAYKSTFNGPDVLKKIQMVFLCLHSMQKDILGEPLPNLQI